MTKLNPLELIGCGAIVVDQDLKVTSWNEASTKILGLKKSQVVNRKLEDILADANHKINKNTIELLSNITTTVTAGQPNPPYNKDFQWQGKWVRVELDGFTMPDGQLRCLITVIDISLYQNEIVRLAKENTELNKKLKKYNISDAWVRKFVLRSLFVCIVVFVGIALISETMFQLNSQNIYTVISSLMSTLGLCIGYYFNNDNTENKNQGYIRGFQPVATPEPISTLPEENILGVE